MSRQSHLPIVATALILAATAGRDAGPPRNEMADILRVVGGFYDRIGASAALNREPVVWAPDGAMKSAWHMP